jgi:hypothetical protein
MGSYGITFEQEAFFVHKRVVKREKRTTAIVVGVGNPPSSASEHTARLSRRRTIGDRQVQDV